MQEEKIKVYIYTRVSTAMQVDGYSLDAQKAKIKAIGWATISTIRHSQDASRKRHVSQLAFLLFNRFMMYAIYQR